MIVFEIKPKWNCIIECSGRHIRLTFHPKYCVQVGENAKDLVRQIMK